MNSFYSGLQTLGHIILYMTTIRYEIPKCTIMHSSHFLIVLTYYHELIILCKHMIAVFLLLFRNMKSISLCSRSVKLCISNN